MKIHTYLNPNAQGFIQQTEHHLGETTAQAAQAGANSILTEQELGNPFDEGLERIWKPTKETANTKYSPQQRHTFNTPTMSQEQ